MGVKIDLDNLRNLINKDKEEAESKSGDKVQFPLVYPAQNGKLTIKLLYNAKSSIIQRKVYRHGRIPCFQGQYGESCPICEAIQNVEAVKGRECGVFSKYGYKTRGICYAQVIDHDPAYFTGDNDPKKKDTVLMMYPKTIFENITNILSDSGDNLLSLVGENEGLAVVIEREQKGKQAPSYRTYVYPYGKVKSFEPDGNVTGDDKFDELLESLPDLNETLVPAYPNEKVREDARAMAETITSEYLKGNVMNPSDSDNSSQPKDEKASSIADSVKSSDDSQESKQSDNTATQESSGRPSCFGHHSNENKCILCDCEVDCMTSGE